MSFWLLQVLTLVAGIATLSVIREPLLKRFPRLSARMHEFGVLFVLAVIALLNVIVHEVDDAHRDAQLEAATRYADVAKQDLWGRTGTATPPLEETGPFIDALRGEWVKGKKGYVPLCDERGLTSLADAAKLQPLSPWPHYGLAFCRLCRADQSWRDEAAVVVNITQHTTLLTPHNSDQDAALRDARGWLMQAGLGAAGMFDSDCDAKRTP